MTNKEFIEEYGVKEMIGLFDNVYIRLALLKAKRKIRNFKINKKQKLVKIYYKGKIFNYEIAKIYSINDNKLLLLLEKEIDNN